MEPSEHTAAKCNYCSHRVDIGLEPACVNVCPEHAIVSGDMDNPLSEISKLLARETVSVRKPEKGTNPKLFYIDGDKASLDPTDAHPDSEYMWSSQSSGVGHFAGNMSSPPSRGGVDPDEIGGRGGGRPSTSQSAETDTKGEGRTELLRKMSGSKSPRRVYDAPNKGVLWGWEVAAYVWTKAIAAGAFMVPVLGGFFMEVPYQLKQIGAWVAMIFLAITGILLIKDLGRPDRFLYVLLRPQWRSWLTRGAYIITSYGGLLTAWIVANYTAQEAWLSVIEPVGIVFALLAAVYTAFLFAQAKGRDFWQSPMLGLHMILHSIMAGLAIFLIVGLFKEMHSGLSLVLFFFTTGLLIIHLITLAIELTTTHATEDAHAVTKMIVRGRFSYQFWLGMILIGNLVPLLLLWTGQTGSLAMAGILILMGILIGDRIWVKAPQLVPLS
jgi:formate-dependent nitrite reductase membrane component NrfD